MAEINAPNLREKGKEVEDLCSDHSHRADVCLAMDLYLLQNKLE